MHAVRKQILDILNEAGGATVAELAAQVEMAPVSVRHHLDLLQGDDLIRVDRVKRKGSVGRPRQVYVLTQNADAHFPDNFAALATGLMRQMKAVLPTEHVSRALRTMAHEMAGEFDGSSDDAPDKQMPQIAGFLSERGYQARVEPTEGGYLVHKHNCPYRGVSAEHRELCQMDGMLINQLTGQSCEHTQSMVDGAACCTYFVPLDSESGFDASQVDDDLVMELTATHA